MVSKFSEYGSLPGDVVWSKRIVIATGITPYTKVELNLAEITEGWAPAGSCAIWKENRWYVGFTKDGVSYGRQFLSLEQAKRFFDEAIAG